MATVDGTRAAAAKFPMSNGTVSKGALVAFTVVDQNDVPTLQPQWVSRDLASPVTPAVVNGVVFALAGGAARGSATASPQKAQPSSGAVLYALDGATGKELWTSGTRSPHLCTGLDRPRETARSTSSLAMAPCTRSACRRSADRASRQKPVTDSNEVQ